MESLEILLISNLDIHGSMKTVSHILDLPDKNSIETTPLGTFPYKPKVSFSKVYIDGVFIKFRVKEDNINKATETLSVMEID